MTLTTIAVFTFVRTSSCKDTLLLDCLYVCVTRYTAAQARGASRHIRHGRTAGGKCCTCSWRSIGIRPRCRRSAARPQHPRTPPHPFRHDACPWPCTCAWQHTRLWLWLWSTATQPGPGRCLSTGVAWTIIRPNTDAGAPPSSSQCCRAGRPQQPPCRPGSTPRSELCMQWECILVLLGGRCVLCTPPI